MDISLPSVNITCTHDAEKNSSSWMWSLNGSAPYYETLLNCELYCEDNPPEGIQGVMARTWDKSKWQGSLLTYSCNTDKDMAFALPGFQVGQKIDMKCLSDNVTGRNIWQFDNEGHKLAKLPPCKHVCKDDPPDDELNVDRTWTRGKWSIGETAKYVCKDKELNFHDYWVYPSITFSCSLLKDENKGIWLRTGWNGTRVSNIPTCKPIQTCGTIQEQINPKRDFNADYVSYKHESYIAVTGSAYVNGSVPSDAPGSKVNLSCYFKSNLT